jgi:hypothetical protein
VTGTFQDTIEHSGSVFFNDASIEAGNFSIGLDASRAGTLDGEASGFVVDSNLGLTGPVFDIGSPNVLTATGTALTIEGDLLASPELSQTLEDAELAEESVAGADVGDALIEAEAVPTPTAALGGFALLGLLTLRRRRLADI